MMLLRSALHASAKPVLPSPSVEETIGYAVYLRVAMLKGNIDSLDGRREQAADNAIALACASLGLFTVVFGLCSLWLRGRVFLSSSVLALAFGVILGPKGLDAVQLVPGGWESGEETDMAKLVLLWVSRIVLSIQVLSVGVTLPSNYFGRKGVRRTLAMLLGPGIALKVVIVAAFAKLLFKIGWLEAALIGSCLAPTDPVLAASVVKGAFAEQHVPPYIRQLLLSESGVNDGSATPFFAFFLLMITTASPAEGLKQWFMEGILRDTVFAVVLGGAIGWIARKLLALSKRYEWVDKESNLVFTMALAIAIAGFVTYLESNELLASVFAGIVLGADGSFRTDELHTHFSEGIDNILDIIVFFTLGTVLPWYAWTRQHDTFPIGKLFGFAILVLLFRRLPLALIGKRYLPVIKTTKEAGFLGWFGPMGIGAIYYALKAGEQLPADNILKQDLYAVISWMVFCSAIVHGVTLPTFLLASSVHPILHPKSLIQSESNQEDRTGELPHVTERSSLLGPFVRFAKRYVHPDEDVIEGDAEAENTPAQRDPNDDDEGLPISRHRLRDILENLNEDDDDGLMREGKGILNREQKRALLGEGSGLNKWNLDQEILAYDEGNVLILADEQGHVSTRKIYRRK